MNAGQYNRQLLVQSLAVRDVMYVHVSGRDLCISESGEVNITPKRAAPF